MGRYRYLKKRKRKLSTQQRGCFDNKDTISLRKFAEHFNLTDRHYAFLKYVNSVTEHLSKNQKRLLQKYDAWKRSRFKRKKSLLDAYKGAEKYDEESGEKQGQTTSAYNKGEAFSRGGAEAKSRANVTDVLKQFETSNNQNIYELFQAFQNEVTKPSNHGRLKIETHLHETFSLTNILLLAPNQHSELLCEVFSEETLKILYDSLYKNMTKNSKLPKTSSDEFDEATITMSRVVLAVEYNKITRDDAEWELLNFARSQTYCLSRVIKGINNALQNLPSHVIKETTPISENELYNSYFDPILSALIADPEKSILLRHSSNHQDKNENRRSGTTISRIQQSKNKYNVGHGEVRIRNIPCDTEPLVWDLFRIGLLAKDSLDQNKLSHVIAFHIHGFTITFYMMTLQFNKIYTFLEIARMNFPRSVDEISTFLSLKNLEVLTSVTRIFWSNCDPVLAPEEITKRYHPTYEIFYEVFNPGKNAHGECSFYSGKV